MNTSPTTFVFLSSVEARLRHVLALPDAERDADPLVASARHLVLAGGKRARPWLVHALGAVVDAPEDGLLDIAVCSELIHAASLLHDDVIDEGHERRGRPTANVLWGNLTAVLGGDLLLTIALQQLRGRAPGLTADAVDVVAIMTRASLLEAALRGRVDVTPEQWRAMAVGKTAELFGFCGRAAAMLVGSEVDADRFQRACRHLGVAFQLANDLDDLYGRTPGKDPLADVANQNPCYPLLVAMTRSEAARRVIETAWASGNPARDALLIQRAVSECGAALQTWDAIRAEVAAAEAALGPHAAHPATAPVLAWAHRLWQQAEPPRAAEGEAPCAGT